MGKLVNTLLATNFDVNYQPNTELLTEIRDTVQQALDLLLARIILETGPEDEPIPVTQEDVNWSESSSKLEQNARETNQLSSEGASKCFSEPNSNQNNEFVSGKHACTTNKRISKTSLHPENSKRLKLSDKLPDQICEADIGPWAASTLHSVLAWCVGVVPCSIAPQIIPVTSMLPCVSDGSSRADDVGVKTAAIVDNNNTRKPSTDKVGLSNNKEDGSTVGVCSALENASQTAPHCTPNARTSEDMQCDNEDETAPHCTTNARTSEDMQCDNEEETASHRTTRDGTTADDTGHGRNLTHFIVKANALLDFTWQKLNTGHWKDVHTCWRLCYTWGTVVLATILLHRLHRTLLGAPTRSMADIAAEAAKVLRTIDMGLLMGAPIASSPLCQCATKLNSIARLKLSYRDRSGVSDDDDDEDAVICDGNVIDSSPANAENASALLTKSSTESKDTTVAPTNSTMYSIDQSFINDKVKNERRKLQQNLEDLQSDAYSSAFNNLVKRPLEMIYLPPVTSFFMSNVSTKVPVKLVGVIDSWSARHKWSVEYLRTIAGARTVPVEVGAKYTDEEWSQELLTLDSYLTQYVSPPLPRAPHRRTGYLAQHQLLDQVPGLRADIAVPDYCHLGGSEPRLHAWIGPEGTVSPLHHDPDHNILAQVVGYKYVRLYPEDQTRYLYPHEDPLLDNTSQVDVEGDLAAFPEFLKAQFFDLILGPGDCVYIPPKCWHFIRSLSISFSVSFWWS